MQQILVDEKKLKWDSARFRVMLAKHGGHRTAEILLALKDFPLECGDAPQLTAEWHVVLPKYASLFDDDQKVTAAGRLKVWSLMKEAR